MKRSTYKKWMVALSNVIILIILFSMAGCKKYLQIPAPTNSISSQNVYTQDATAIGVLNGIYIKMQGYTDLSISPGCSADEFTLLSTSVILNLTYSNKLNSDASGNTDLWSAFYKYVYYANAAIEGLNQSSTLTPAVKQQLIGEAEFIRAWCYFYLVNIYGDVPLALTTDYKANAVLTRSTKTQVYQQIIADLTDAQTKLSANFVDVTLLKTTTARVRPTKWAATALLARAYLYYGDLTGDATNYTRAADQASAIIQNSTLFSLVTLNNAFLTNNQEAIWQLEASPATIGGYTQEAFLFIIPATGPSSSNYLAISPFLLAAFEPSDRRRTDWINSVNISGTTLYYAYKYKNNVVRSTTTEYETVFRLAEQYLILAEAYAERGDLVNAATNLNKIRTRAGLPNTTASTQSEILAAIQHERQVEFFTEFGHRWFDLKRTKTVNAVMTVVTPKKGGVSWDPNQALYPIPLAQIQAAPQLQPNPGY
ncbi:RagB/SusD family nutrient uptake outer membrane protein [Pedobacter sp. ISL-68]|uniref:RagB/SusD family nutrient uptake outer membrane protein n=1 Tax=unclassified Pedobacter TaxID=2628915 RepID=UPI001BE66AAC|nr:MULTISPECIES: RagB/SusD family nutrient uptake outer membrane protein [unclassified Pedobacter]MBT2563117.1 RagB/SusD family nutrient uptake outer membrane protein [Pedobacter sp. ISL-64]MBT2593455.1 RagB/SusD family nutrient uptake outer membrane protein [Pedobacter sp. ISL-68]